MTTNPPKFYAIKYKQTTLQQWNSAAEARQEIEEALAQFEINGQFDGPCEMLVAVGRK